MLFCRMLRWSLRCVLRRPPHTLLPYTTLFRSIGGHQTVEAVTVEQVAQDFPLLQLIIDDQDDTRSEEHTSELQSRGHLVCRLLLEKKNHIHTCHELVKYMLIHTPESHTSIARQ